MNKITIEQIKKLNAERTHGGWEAKIDMDGRHHYLAILATAPEFKDEEWPYHPLIIQVPHGRGSAPRNIAEGNAAFIAAAPAIAELAIQQAEEIERLKYGLNNLVKESAEYRSNVLQFIREISGNIETIEGKAVIFAKEINSAGDIHAQALNNTKE